MSKKMKRHLWICPLCGRRYNIPVGNDPERCPDCLTQNSSQSRSVSQTLKKRTSADRRRWFIGIAVLGMVAVLGIIGAFLSGMFRVPELVAKRIAVLDNDPDRAAVRKWLSENLDAPEFEEVKWWPTIIINGEKDITSYKKELVEFANKKHVLEQAISVKESKRRPESEIFPLRRDRRNAEDVILFLKHSLESALKEGPKRLIRVKFRSSTPFGGKKIQDYVYLLENDIAFMAGVNHQLLKDSLFENQTVEKQGMNLGEVLDDMKRNK